MMIKPKIYHHLFLFLFVWGLMWTPLAAQQMGKKLFNENWQFHLGDMEMEQVQSGSGTWKSLELPHDWSVEGPFSAEWASGTGYLPGGTAWYRKAFDVANWEEGNQYAIYFDGVYKNSEVWINGEFLGKRPNGFIPFQYDLTPHLKKEGNVILVKVDHKDYADSRYYTGSGIYRNVYLITMDQHHFSQWGVFFKTPEVNEEQAQVTLEMAFENHEGANREVELRVALKERTGETVARYKVQSMSEPGKKNQAYIDFTLDKPKRWSPENPYLYDLRVSLWVNGQRVDQWEEKVGFRSFEFDPDKGFSLNGKSMLLKGVCIHHDAGALGAAVPEEVWRNRLETLKELGCNAIRMSHYPHQDYLYELCDEMGFLVQDEAFDEWEVGKNKWIEGWNVGTPGNDGYHEAFAEWAHQDVADMVLRSRNRPSIIMWSIGNEIDYPNDPYSHPVLDEGRNPQIYGKGYQENNPPASRLEELSKGLVNAVKQHDDTRPVTAALAGVTMSNHTDYPASLDIVGYNYQEYRYPEDHENFPDRVIYGSENGDALSAWLAVSENEYIASQFLWTAFDFLGEARSWPSRSSGAGIIDLAGYPKPDFYFRKSLWHDAPMVYLGVADSEEDVLRRRNISDAWKGSEGESKWITCYANTEEVELFVNGKSHGKKMARYSEEGMISWQVDFVEGEIMAKGYNHGEVVAEYSLNTPGAMSQLAVNMEKGTYSKNKETLEVEIRLTDDQGNLITDNDQEVHLEIKGPAKLLGLESGDLSSHESYQASHRMTCKGKLKGYLQTTGTDQDLFITVKAEGLPERELVVRAK